MNERNKKVYAIIVAVLLVLSVATSFLPSIQVNADEEPISFLVTSLDFISSGRFTGIDSGFNYSLYQTGYNEAISSEKFPLDSLENVVSADRNPFPRSVDGVYDRLISNFDNYNYSVNFNDYGSGSTYNALKDFITDPSKFNYQVIIGNSSYSSNPMINIYYSHGDLKMCQVNKSVYAYSNDTIYNMTVPFSQDVTADYRNIHTYSANSLQKVDDTLYNLYSTFPVFLTYQDNGVSGDSDYSSYSTASTLATDYLVNGVNSEFFIDRRLLFSNFIPDTPNFNVDNDPLSQEYKGAWDIDLVPVDDLLDGSIKVKFVPTQKLSTDNPNYSVKYYFGFFFNGRKFNFNSLIDKPLMLHGLSQIIYGNYDTPFKSITLNNYYNVTDNDGISVNSVSGDYVSFPTSTVLRGLTPVGSYTLQGALVGGNLGQNSNPINVYQSLSFYKSQNCFNQNNGGNNIGGTFGNVSVGLSSNQGGITSAKLIVQAQAFYNGSEASNVATVTYNYLTGEITKQGTVSTDNNTPVDSTTGIPDGITPQEQQAIDSSTQNIVTNGGSISGGNNTNQNTNNPTFTNNNNPSITINNNNGLTEPDGVPENPDEGSFSMLWSIWESYHFAEWLNQDLEGNGFLHYIFSSEIWDLPIFNLIIPALAILITVSIASTIIRFIRGN